MKHVVVIVTAAGCVAAAVVLAASTGTPQSRTASASTSVSAAVPTFAADVAPIVYANCVTCHRPGQAAPFSLLTYEDVRKHGDDIADATRNRYMPPWHASKAEGFPEFQDERHLTDKDLSTLERWVDGGMPSGDLKKTPAPPVFPAGWALGRPDVVLKFSWPVNVPAEGPDQYRNVMLSVDLPEDRWITAIDYQPSARSVVHHALYFTSPAGTEVRDDEIVPGLGRLGAGLGGGQARGAAGGGALGAGRGAGLGRLGAGGGATSALGAAGDAWGGLGGWVPGMTPRFYPEGIAQPLAKHTNLVLQLHLHPSGKVEQEQGEMAVYFSKTPPRKSLMGVQVPPAFGVGMGIDIPAGESNYKIHDSFVLPVDIEAFGVRGHAHYLAKTMKMVATLPDGTTKGLLWVSDWDFSWQDSYYFKNTFGLPKGTRIDTDITYDNSPTNIRNPSSPPKRVRWGRESFDEMGSMTLLVTTPTPADSLTLRDAQAEKLRQQVLLRMMIRR